MAKKPVKKSSAKKTATKTVKTPAKKAVKKATKKSAAKKAATKKVVRKPLTDKELLQREANVIANLENRKKPESAKTKRPKKTATNEQTSTLLDAVIEGMKERKAKNITVLNLTGIENRVCDYFVICDADSKTHVESIADSVEETVLKLTNEKAYDSEGHANSEWILVDYVNIVAHVFLREIRDHYNIEALWGDAEITFINN